LPHLDKKPTPDELDRKILSLLFENARMSLVEIGERVGLSAPAVKRRIERLERDGTIRGYSAVVDQQAMGWGTEAFLEVFFEGDTSLASLRISSGPSSGSTASRTWHAPRPRSCSRRSSNATWAAPAIDTPPPAVGYSP
jgi:predicted transcriptional regulator